jgi:hypothetical protein
VILLAAVLVLAGIGLLAAGLIEGSATLQWASFAASALAALVVITGEVRRHLAARRSGDDAADRVGDERTAPTGRPDRPERPDRLSSDRFPAVPPAGPPSRPQPLQPPARPYEQEQDEQEQDEQQQYEPERYEPEPAEPQPYDRPQADQPYAQPYDLPFGTPPSQPQRYDAPSSGAQDAAPPTYLRLPDADPSFGREGPAGDAWAAPHDLYEPPWDGTRQPAGATAYQPPPYVPPPTPPADDDTTLLAPSDAGAGPGHPAVQHDPGTAGTPPATDADGEPPVEEVEVTDLLVVLDLTDEVLVVDEHPRYHLGGCPHVNGVATFAMPMVEARTDGFTPCATCAPDRNLARVERARRSRS